MAIGIGLIIAIVLLVVVLGLAGFVVGVYNKLVTMRNRYKNAYAQIDVQLKRRYDLIPNLVEIAKGYIKHERETLENVTKARNIAYVASQAAAANPGDSGAMKNLVSAESGLAGTLSRLMMVSEQYPDLKANQNMMQLTEELTSTENKISFARQAYNDSVMFITPTARCSRATWLPACSTSARRSCLSWTNRNKRTRPRSPFSDSVLPASCRQKQ